MDDTKRMLTAMVLCMAIMMGWLYFTGKFEQSPPAPDPTAPPQTSTQPAPPTPAAAADPSRPATPPPVFTGAWRVKPAPAPEADIILGNSNSQPEGYKAQITINAASASIHQALLSEHKLKVTDEQTGYPLLASAPDHKNRQRSSLMLGQFTIGGRKETFDLAGPCWTKTAQSTDQNSSTVSYTATIVDEKDRPILDVIKTFTYAPNDYQLAFDLKLDNRSGGPLEITSLEMFGPLGPIREDPRSDRRKAAAAYIDADGEIEIEDVMAQKVLPKRQSAFLTRPSGGSFLWFSVSNKFFAAVLRPVPDDEAARIDYIDKGQVEAIPLGPDPKTRALGSRVDLTTSQPLAARAQLTCNFLLYLGPIDKDIFEQPEYADLHYEKLLGARACGFCTFDFLTFGILKMMKAIYHVTKNYGIAIIILVLIVRIALHPIMKKSQANMMKMQKMAPRMEEIKKKYANNKEEMQRQMQAMYKEQGPAMILGCLPLALQMPVLIALYTAADANVALRHQGLLPASWHWLNDLSAPDRLIPFSWFDISPIDLPLIGSLVGTIDAVNILPILLCVAMYLQQKLSPQSAMASANPQAAQQQKMMLIMMPVMMLLFFYSAPSGVNLYFMTSTFAGIIEQKRIRKHLAEEQAQKDAVTVDAPSKVTGRFGPKKPKPKPPTRYN